ncbi:MAG: response regulator [Mariprofundaceae bacterium]|nr:response regulator [Mariprofundaceae bacterium]
MIIRPLLQKSKASQRKIDILLAALDGASNCIMISNSDADVIYVNQAFTTITGYDAQDILGKNPRMLQSDKQDQQFYKMMWHTIHTVGEWQGELWNRRKDGSEYLESLHIKTVHTKYAAKPYYIGIITDITLKKQHETLLAHAEKMASIGTLVGGIAHNFNNLLSSIIGNAYLAQDETNPSKTNERLQLIERISFDASEMVKSLLVFARNHDPKKKNIAITPVLKHAIQTAKFRLPDDIIFTVNLPDGEPMLYCDAVEIQQVMLNLISNARDALPEQGERSIRINVRQTHSEPCHGRQQCNNCSAHALKISVQDSGSGISDDVLPHIFDPFFSTKEVGMGTGLGLSTTFSTIQAHGGSLHTHNLEPQGCSFEVCLPLSFTESQDVSEVNHVQTAKKNATILIVDDEPMVRNTLQQVMGSLGYKTLLANQGQEAINIMQQKHVDLVISDVVMPVLDGVSAVAIMRQSQPKLPVIFITGYEQKFDEIIQNAHTQRIAKPFDIKILSQEVHVLLQDTLES